MPTQSPYSWIDPVYQVAFRINSTDNTELNYICCTEAALGQATVLANLPLTATESPTDLKTLQLRCRDLLITPGGHSIRVAAMFPTQEISKARAEA